MTDTILGKNIITQASEERRIDTRNEEDGMHADVEPSFTQNTESEPQEATPSKSINIEEYAVALKNDHGSSDTETPCQETKGGESRKDLTKEHPSSEENKTRPAEYPNLVRTNLKPLFIRQVLKIKGDLGLRQRPSKSQEL